MVILSATNSVEIRNMLFSGCYVHTYLNADDPGGQFQAIYDQGITSCSLFHVHNNEVRNATHGMSYVPATANESCLEFDHNDIQFANTGIDIAATSQTASGSKIHDNNFSNRYVWDIANFQTTGCGGYHGNSMHAYGTTTGIQFYDNVAGGNWGGCMTALVFLEGGGWNNQNAKIYNNLFIATYDFPPTQTVIAASGGTNYYDNNTFLGASQNGNDLDLENASGTGVPGTWDMRNNVICCDNTIYAGGTALAFATIDYNLWAGAVGSSGPWGYNCHSGCTYDATLSAWQTATGGETHSFYNSSASYPNINGTTGIPNNGSPVIGQGVNLTSLSSALPAITSDIYGNARPSSGAWNIGAVNTQTFTLTVVATGSAVVNDSQGAIVNCTSSTLPASCSGSVNGSDTLTATVTSGSFFGWSGGGCSGQSTCTLTLSVNTAVTATGGGPCGGPPLYLKCRQDTNIAPLAATPPLTGLTGAGTSYVDSQFGNYGIRLTDSNTNGANQLWVATISGDSQNKCTPDDQICFLATGFGVDWPFSIAYNSSGQPIGATMLYSGSFNLSNAAHATRVPGSHSYYTMSSSVATGTQLQKFSVTAPYSVAPTPTLFYDFASSSNGLAGFTDIVTYTINNHGSGGYLTGDVLTTSTGAHFKVAASSGSITTLTQQTGGTGNSIATGVSLTYVSGSGTGTGATINITQIGFFPSWVGDFNTPVGQDSLFVEGFSDTGIQDTGEYLLAYSPAKGVMKWNTATGIVSCDAGWGTCGSINLPDRFLIHAGQASSDGRYITVAYDTCLSSCTITSSSQYIWDTTNPLVVGYCPTGGGGANCSGHGAKGASNYFDNPNSGVFNARSYANPSTYTTITSAPPGTTTPWDGHGSYENNQTPYDTLPFMFGTFQSTNPYPAAWYDEILLINGSVAAPGEVWRMGQTFNSANNQLFQCQVANPVITQDGKYALYGTDMEGNLGSTSGGSSCTLGTNCRCDVVMLMLGQQANLPASGSQFTGGELSKGSTIK